METSKKATPVIVRPKCTAAKKLLDLALKISSFNATPGVINSVTPLFTIVLACLGSSN